MSGVAASGTRQPDVLLDLDGTLSDNFPGIAACIRHALARLDAPPPVDAALRACVGPPLRESFARLLGSDAPEVIERAMAHYRERFEDIGWRENAAYPGVAEALACIAGAGARLFLCTAKPATYARRIVEHFGFAGHFAGIYGPELGGHLDDKAALMAHLIARERIEPARAAMIGDRGNDIRAAHANGVRAIGVLWGYGDAEELRGADALVDAPPALPAAVLQRASAGTQSVA